MILVVNNWVRVFYSGRNILNGGENRELENPVTFSAFLVIQKGKRNLNN